MSASVGPNMESPPVGARMLAGPNQLALVSLIVSFIAPLAVAFAITVNVASAQPKGVSPSPWQMVAGVVGSAIVPAMIATIILGHLALHRAKRFPRPQARRWMAITALVIGYIAVVAFVGVFVLAFFLFA